MSQAPSNDQLHRFIFDKHDIRGKVLTLGTAFVQATAHQHLPPAAQRILGEFLAAASLLAEALKFSGTLTLQVRGNGPLPLIMAEANTDRSIRGIAKVAEHTTAQQMENQSWRELIGNGVLSLTLDPEKGQRYQGIVAVEGETIADALSNYFAQSEQLPTRFWLFADEHHAGGLLLQALPNHQSDTDANQDAWQTAETLATTLTPEELNGLAHSEILYRLFHEFDVRLFEPEHVHFTCKCSKARSARALTSLGYDDAMALLAERDVIEMGCEFCGTQYTFDHQDLQDIFGSDSSSVH